jgi:hypothetical protein
MIFFLATHPEAEAAVIAEVDRWGRGRPIGLGDLAAFPYTNVSPSRPHAARAGSLAAGPQQPAPSCLVWLCRRPRAGLFRTRAARQPAS